MKTWKRKCALVLLFAMALAMTPAGEKTAQARTKTLIIKAGKMRKVLIHGGKKARKIM